MALNEDIFLDDESLKAFYNKYFSYYTSLDQDWKKEFIKRCLFFAKNKHIIGAEGFKVNNMVKAIIAASAVQLTLGLQTWKLDYFETIIVHPKDFKDTISGVNFKGETNLAGHIRLSWQSFLMGYQEKKDNINLGLHEFTHALRFNPIKGYAQDYFIEHYFNAWMATAIEAFNDIRLNKETVFRKYGGTNMNEFMSVCIEHFFESPEQIKQKYPLLYYNTALMLNQITENGVTRLNVREFLFEKKCDLLELRNIYDINTSWKNATSVKMLAAFIVPLIYTIFVTGFLSAESIILTSISALLYLRFDYYYIITKFSNKNLHIKKGFLLFKNRVVRDLSISHLVSVRVYGNGSGDSEVELIYYYKNDQFFYEESISSGVTLDDSFLNEMTSNKIAIFKS